LRSSRTGGPTVTGRSLTEAAGGSASMRSTIGNSGPSTCGSRRAVSVWNTRSNRPSTGSCGPNPGWLDRPFEHSLDGHLTGRRRGLRDRRVRQGRGHPAATDQHDASVGELQRGQDVEAGLAAERVLLPALQHLLVGTVGAADGDPAELQGASSTTDGPGGVGQRRRSAGGSHPCRREGVGGPQLVQPVELPEAERDAGDRDGEHEQVGEERARAQQVGAHRRRG
jgi:hypothetical protein